ncbi:MAG: DUF92 domain-containing protein [Chloroflexi bacterium]|nr:DUF92 domain-containing protein [Chloroflexota bacterium]
MNFSAFLLGILFSLAIAAFGYARGSLSRGGAFGAMIVGTLVFAGGGLLWAVLLVAFFVSSSALSHYHARAKEPLAEKFQKGPRRDFAQVLANGGAGALIALAYGFNPQPAFFFAFLGALATVNADTWATELGVLSKTPPRLITTGKIVATGTSGGITRLGTLVALGGALFIGMIAALSIAIGKLSYLTSNFQPPISNLPVFIFVTAFSGLVGSLFDSVLGATVQAIYYCDFDQTETESRVHRCGRATRRVRGWRWLDNDAVNFLASVAGSVVAIIGSWVV